LHFPERKKKRTSTINKLSMEEILEKSKEHVRMSKIMK